MFATLFRPKDRRREEALTALAASPAAQNALAEKDAGRSERRREIVRQLAETQKDQATETQVMAAKVAKATAMLRSAKENYENAEKEFILAASASHGLHHGHGEELGRLEGELRELAPPPLLDLMAALGLAAAAAGSKHCSLLFGLKRDAEALLHELDESRVAVETEKLQMQLANYHDRLLRGQ